MPPKLDRAIILAEKLSSEARGLHEILQRPPQQDEVRVDTFKAAPAFTNVDRIWTLRTLKGGGTQVNRDIKTLDSRMSRLEKQFLAFEQRLFSRVDRLESQLKELSHELKAQRKDKANSVIASSRKVKRKPSEYNLFLKDKMSSGMTMVDAVKAWKEREGGGILSDASHEAGQSWHSPRTQY